MTSAGCHTATLSGTVARPAGMSHAGAGRVLAQLVEHGLVMAEPVGAANLYQLNRDHLQVGPALDLLGALDRLERHLEVAVRGWPMPCAGCALFGSAARRDGSTRSDLDVLVLRPDTVSIKDPVWRSQLDQTAGQAERWTGNRLSWVEFDTSMFTQMITAVDPLIGQLRRDAHWLVEPAPPIGPTPSASAMSA